jgi:hypothetical protein
MLLADKFGEIGRTHSHSQRSFGRDFGINSIGEQRIIFPSSHNRRIITAYWSFEKQKTEKLIGGERSGY